MDETSAAIHLIANLPARTNIPELTIRPTWQRSVADEIVELLEDGEEVDWIVTQVMPSATEENRSELTQILNDIAREVAPPSAVEEEQDPEAAVEVAEAETEAEAEDMEEG